jgi:hypothetical protein
MAKALTPGLCYTLLTTVTHERSPYQVFHSFYEEMPDKFPISVTTKNLFLTLVKSIAQTLNITLCYECGAANMGDHWLWEARELDPRVPFNGKCLPTTQDRRLTP